MSLWRGKPLILASKSAVRKQILEAAGIPVAVDPANIVERAVEASKGASFSAKEVALLLAREKALETARRRPSEVVLGADQTLAVGERRFTKPASLAAAHDQLAALSGRTHELHSALAVVRDGSVAFQTVVTARLSMRALSNEFIDAYVRTLENRVSTSVGAYQLESLGVHLFEKIEGDHFTILGIPLLPLLAYFRSAGLVVS